MNSRARYAFICYAREDAAQVDLLQRDLQTAGVQVWRDTAQLWPGEDWRAKITEAIEHESFVFIACFSRAGLSQERRYQNRELVQAVEQLRQRPQGDEWFIPVRLDDCDIPAYDIGGGRTLASLEPTDLFDERRDEQATRLVQTVLGNLRRQEGQSGSRPLGWLRSGRALAVTASVALAVGAGVLLPHLLSPTGPTGPGSRPSSGRSIAPSSVGSQARSVSPGSTSPAPALVPTTFVSDPEVHRLFPGRRAVSIAPASALPASVHAYSGDSYNFQGPEAIAADGTHVWVANADGNSVTELNEDNGSLVQNLRDASYGFNNPGAVAVVGGHVWVANRGGGDDGSVTELNEDNGSLVKVLTGSGYGFISPDAIAANGTDIWVTNPGVGHGSVKELNADNGTLMRTLSAPSYGFDDPAAIAVEGADVWVANYANSTVTELDATNYSVVRVLFTSNYRFDHPAAIAADGTHVWVVNSFGDSVTELNADDGTLAQVVSSGTYEFYDPDAIAEDSAHVWVASSYGDFVTELNADNGDLVKIWPSDVYGFENPRSIAADGTHVWVGSQKTDASAGADANWVTRFPVS